MKLGAPLEGRGAYHDTFRLSITKALGDQLAEALKGLDHAPLTEECLAAVEERPGVYQLYLGGEFVYVGKADNSLRGRLANHLRKLRGRRHIDITEMSFSCLYVAEDFSALAPEKLLIKRYKDSGGIPWNNNGFGNKDPGRQRDTTILKKNHFDLTYPINLDLPVTGLSAGEVTLSNFLKRLKSGLPYNFRYVEPPKSHSTVLRIPQGPLSADIAFRLLSRAVPESWQVSALMGYVIMYGDAPSKYGSAWRYYRSGDVVDAVPEVSPEEMVEEEDSVQEGLFGSE
ncbi:GIY-YIG nuclease family protein [Nocardia sp. NRRL S-836]|uniref:GIY-YIG nuclease family protein n=1 Tax=Nocardia sp. NRRL S-836 TaxID=1519492 RepID=UPI0006AFABE0|nr:GIY-YIG nuclease family protein [Nocardia sp. NRRL S-836]KOV89035.1 restriction endonuclease Eco29kI [Nocardia sp. NRRL S-836]